LKKICPARFERGNCADKEEWRKSRHGCTNVGRRRKQVWKRIPFFKGNAGRMREAAKRGNGKAWGGVQGMRKVMAGWRREACEKV